MKSVVDVWDTTTLGSVFKLKTFTIDPLIDPNNKGYDNLRTFNDSSKILILATAQAGRYNLRMDFGFNPLSTPQIISLTREF
jgi:hypothetical protein